MKKGLIVVVVVVAAQVSQAQLLNLGIEGGYGKWTAPVENSKLKNSLPFIGDGSKSDSKGAYNVGVYFTLLKFTISGLAAFETVNQKSGGNSDYVQTKNKYTTLMARLQWNYFGLVLVHFYGGVGAGVAHVKSTVEEASDATKVGNASSASKFAYQITPLGVRVGRKLCVYLEGGYGYLGALNGGIRLGL